MRTEKKYYVAVWQSAAGKEITAYIRASDLRSARAYLKLRLAAESKIQTLKQTDRENITQASLCLNFKLGDSV